MNAGMYLKSLNLRNFATFENQEIFFNPKFNGIVGETGSGKSLILDAFQLLLGTRADKKLIRKGADCALIEGVFQINDPKLAQYFDETGFPLEEPGEVVVKRIIYSSGKSKSFLNHMNCPLVTLNKFAKTFVDLVGQFENQKLVQSEYQLYLLDQYAEHMDDVTKFSQLYEQYKDLSHEVIELEQKVKDKGQREDYIRFQRDELKTLNPSVEKEKELIQIKEQLVNKEGYAQDLELIKELCSEGEHNILQNLKSVVKLLEKSSALFDDEMREGFYQILSQFEDFSYEISKKEIQDEEDIVLEDVLEALDSYQKLKRKFNTSTEELSSLLGDLERELEELGQLDTLLLEKQKKKNTLENQLYSKAKKLHEKRVEAANSLSGKITSFLKELNMEGATFSIQTSLGQSFTSHGMSLIEFQAETNPGEGFYKIKDIASGGELSRILLSLRQIVASEDTISIFFFDEIDTGIGGETAQKIAKALKKVSEKSQVLAITHLPQIAKAVDEIIYVDKKSTNKDNEVRTVSFVSNKTGRERTKVIELLAGL